MALSPTPVSSAEGRTVLVNQVSWGAIFAGAVAALVAQMILNMVGLGIGLSTLNPTGTDTPSASSLSTGAGLWWVGSGIVASLIGGFLAGRLSGKPVGSTSGYHGLISWAVTTLVIVYLLTSAVGGILAPLALEKMGRDPAVSSSIFVTFLTDFAGFFSVLLIAALLFD